MEPPAPKSDKSDAKATNNLIERLMTLARDRPNPSKSPKTPPNRKRTLKPEAQHSKITSWLTNENKPKRQKTDRNSKMKPLDIVVKSDKATSSKSLRRVPSSERYGVEVPSFEKIRSDQEKFAQYKEKVNKLTSAVDKKSKSKSRSLKRNSSFEKYGIAMPSFEKILADQKEFDIHKENVKKLDVFDENILHKSLARDCLDVKEFTGELLDCKHLSPRDLDEAFKKHLQALSDIINGKKYSERHNQFYKQVPEMSLSKDLRCSASSMVFSQEQKDHLLDLMRSEFDPEDKLTSYFFKVLLPELCLLIFMDEHNMSKRKASAYLNTRPLD